MGFSNGLIVHYILAIMAIHVNHITENIYSDGGGVTFEGNAVGELTSAPSADHSVNGLYGSFIADATVGFGDACFVNSDGEMAIGKADAIATASCVGLAMAAITGASSGNFLLFGLARDDTWTWTVGGMIYLSTTGSTTNTLTQTTPSGSGDVVQILGVATHADRMLFNPQLSQVEIA